MSRSLIVRISAVVLVMLGLSAAPATAQTNTYTWNGSVDTSWFESLNWSAVGPGGEFGPPITSLTNTVVILAGNTRTTNDMDISFSTNSLTFAASAGPFVVGTSSGETMTVGTGGISVLSNNNQTFNANLAAGAAGTWSNSGTGTFTVNGTINNGGNLLTVGGSGNSVYNGLISGAGGLTKTGSGTLTLTATNTFLGNISITGGVLSINASGAIPAGTASILLDGGTLRNTNAGNGNPFLSPTHPITIGANGGTLDVAAGIVLTYIGTATTPGGSIGGTGVLTKTGPGTLRLSNTAISPAVHSIVSVPKLVVTGGLWQGGIDTAFGAVPASYLADAITLDGGGISANAGLSISVNRGITVGASGGVLNSASSLAILSRIVGSGGITKTGANVNAVTLTGLTTYTGSTTVSAGILRAGATNAFSASSAFTLTNTSGIGGSVLDLNNFSQTIGSLAGGGALGGNVTLGSGTLTTGGDNTSTTFGGIISGTGGLTKAGTGTMTLSGVNTYTGATNVNAGTLAIGTGGSLAAASVVSVNNTGTLSGTGTVNGAVTVVNGGRLAAGISGAGTLTIGGNTVIQNGGRLAIGAAANGTSSRVNVVGGSTTFDFKIDSALELTLLSGFSNASPASYTLVSMPAGGGNNLLLAGIPMVDGIPFGTYVEGTGASGSVVIIPSGFALATGDTFTLSRAGDAVVLSFQPVPEPATVLGLAAGALWVGRLVRRRFRREEREYLGKMF